jgi:DNA modification methylase
VPGDVFDMQYPSPGDVFDFPRVTGNSKQRCDWSPTQLHEDLVERVVKFSCKKTGRVLDPFAGTGTTLRVCERLGLGCTTIEIGRSTCEEIARHHSLLAAGEGVWAKS